MNYQDPPRHPPSELSDLPHIKIYILEAYFYILATSKANTASIPALQRQLFEMAMRVLQIKPQKMMKA